jgi:phosphoribosylanthranilate isomerase
VLKVCGVTTVEDARTVAALGVELVGLNFYPRSPRYLDVDGARAVRRALGDRVLAVGVFVDAPPGLVSDVESRVGLDLLQLHGEMPSIDLAPLEQRAIGAFRGAPPSPRTLDRWAASWGLLFDTPAEPLDDPTQHGGTGRTWRYEAIAPLVASSPRRRILVAGGISPANVAAVLERLPGVWGLDVCSGVESTPGRKDPSKVAAMLDAVRRSAHAPAVAPAAHPSGERA